jgi:hypothetical protein
MKMILGFLSKVVTLSFAALIGNWVGGQLRFLLTGEQPQTIQFIYRTQKGRRLKNSPVATKFFPAILFSQFGKPNWLYAILGGIIAGGFVPDVWEHYWLEFVIEPLFIDRVLGENQQ